MEFSSLIWMIESWKQQNLILLLDKLFDFNISSSNIKIYKHDAEKLESEMTNKSVI